jgi:hypothetical protein
MERIVLLRLSHHVDHNSLADPHQSAYRAHHSCELTLLSLQDTVLRAADRGEVTAIVLLDLSCAFDTVDHDILVQRLFNIGVRGDALSWFRSYLASRKQCVLIDGAKSASKHLICGVPQGSVLGPVLFSIYIRPLADIIQQHSINYKFYADDVQLYLSFPPHLASQAISDLEQCIAAIHRWLCHNMLRLNSSKSELILLGTRPQLAKCPDFSVSVDGVKLMRKSVVRDLGVMIDDTLNYDNHSTSVARAAFGYLRVVARIRNHINRQHCEMLLHSLVLSRIDYCVSLLAGANISITTRLQRVIKASSRMALRIPRSRSLPVDGSPVFLSVQQRILRRIVTIVFHALHGRAPSFIVQLLEYQTPSSWHLRSRDQNLLLVPWVRTELGKRAFSVTAPTMWNALPLDVRSSNSLSGLLNYLDNHDAV